MRKAFLQMLVWLVVVWCLAPFAWQIVTSLKTNAELTSIPAVYLPTHPTLDHYRALFSRKPFAHYLWNSFLISSVSTTLCVLISAMAAYTFSRLQVRGAKKSQMGLISISFFPTIVFFFPLYELVRRTGLMNNPVALIIPYVTFNLPFATLILTAFFRTISHEIEEAAKVDGFNRWQILLKIIMPLSAPALATTAILIFIFCWNEFLLALSFMPRDAAKTVTAGVASLSGGSIYEIPWGAIAAAIVLSTLPLIVLVVIFQRRIIQGLTAGATKG